MHEQMKTIRHISVKIAALLLILSGASGCNSFLNVEVIGKSTIDSFFKDIDGLKLAGEGLHATIYDFYDDYYVRYPEIMGDLLNVNVVNADEGTYLLFNYSMKPDYNASYPYNIWKSGYVICTNANNIIEYAPQHREEDPDLVNKVMGYAYFARALAHFGLCNCYGQPYNFTPDASHKGVIAIDHIPGSGEMLPRNSVKEVYELVISDLEKACSLLRDEYYSDCYHISKYACEALLARVYLYMEDWEKAEEYSKKLIDRFPLSPADEYVNMFRYPVKYPGKETILRMNGYNKTSGMNSQCDPVRSNGQKLLPDPSFSNLFDMDDVRKSLLTWPLHRKNLSAMLPGSCMVIWKIPSINLQSEKEREPITFFLFCFFLQIIQSLSFSAVFCYINVTKSFECCLTGAGMRSQHTCFTPESHHHPNIE